IYILEPQTPFKYNSNKEFRKSKFQSFENQNSRVLKVKKQEFRKSKSNDTDSSDTKYIETKNNDTNDMNDMNDSSNMISNNSHSNHTNHQQTEFNNDALKFQALEELPSQIKSYLSNFEIKDIRIIKSVLLKGKKSFNNAHDTYYRLEDVEFELVSVLKRFKAMLLQKDESVEAMQGYLMQSIKAELEEIHALNMRRQNISKYNIFNQ
ncbi:replication protein, partial [Staphylococcus epidermidis]|nr:replication protein [Staphylococcus epidermidis]